MGSEVWLECDTACVRSRISYSIGTWHARDDVGDLRGLRGDAMAWNEKLMTNAQTRRAELSVAQINDATWKVS